MEEDENPITGFLSRFNKLSLILLGPLFLLALPLALHLGAWLFWGGLGGTAVALYRSFVRRDV